MRRKATDAEVADHILAELEKVREAVLRGKGEITHLLLCSASDGEVHEGDFRGLRIGGVADSRYAIAMAAAILRMQGLSPGGTAPPQVKAAILKVADIIDSLTGMETAKPESSVISDFSGAAN